MTRSVYRLTGGDARHFLQGLITNDLNGIDKGLVYTAMLTPQGKYIADFFLLADGDAVLLDVDAAMGPALVQRLGMYKLRADVQIPGGGTQLVSPLGERLVEYREVLLEDGERVEQRHQLRFAVLDAVEVRQLRLAVGDVTQFGLELLDALLLLRGVGDLALELCDPVGQHRDLLVGVGAPHHRPRQQQRDQQPRRIRRGFGLRPRPPVRASVPSTGERHGRGG